MAHVGIYLIVHSATNSVYVGQSLNIEARFSDHKTMLKNGSHHAKRLQELWNISGGEGFDFVIHRNAPICNRGDELQIWLVDAEREAFNHFRSSWQLLNAIYPTKVQTVESLTDIRRSHLDEMEVAKSRLVILRSKISDLSTKVSPARQKLTMAYSQLNEISGFFAWLFGRRDIVKAEKLQREINTLSQFVAEIDGQISKLRSEESGVDSQRKMMNLSARKINRSLKVRKIKSSSRK